MNVITTIKPVMEYNTGRFFQEMGDYWRPQSFVYIYDIWQNDVRYYEDKVYNL